MVVVDIGSRTLAMAQSVVHQVTVVVAPGSVPLFLTEGSRYATPSAVCPSSSPLHLDSFLSTSVLKMRCISTRNE
ncbi:MAG TPA: hypothetical protein VI542_15665, partial [Candidatus Tectomicrobia bacterium]